ARADHTPLDAALREQINEPSSRLGVLAEELLRLGWHDTGLSSSIRHERLLASRIRPFARTTPRFHVKPRRGSAPPGRWPRTPTAIRASTLVSREPWKGTSSVTTVSCSAGHAAGALAIGARGLLGTNELTLMRPATPRRGGTHYRNTPECRRV